MCVYACVIAMSNYVYTCVSCICMSGILLRVHYETLQS